MNKKKRSNKAKRLRSDLQWAGIIAVIAVIYFAGWHTTILGTMQRALLWTGILNPKVEQVVKTKLPVLTDKAYHFTLAGPDGEQLQLEKFRGKVLFINLWASWCPPCIAEMPTIENLYHHFSGNENIKFLLISLDKKQQKATNFMENHEFAMPYYFPVGPIPAAFQSSTIPTTFVISKEGKMIYKENGMANYNSDSFKQWLIKQVYLDE